MILHGDSLHKLKELGDSTIDAVVTDPPYGLKFMGKKWDYSVPSVELWKEVFRVLKPGGHLLSFGGTRTYHRMVVAIEDAGFEIRDQIQWIYGSGFPKSHDISKAIDKKAGVKREVLAIKTEHNIKSGKGNQTRLHNSAGNRETIEIPITKPATNEAKQWQGWGTALKPANEPICLARKPLVGTVQENVLKYGTGAINIDKCRVDAQDINELQKNWDRERSQSMENDRPSYGKFSAINLRDRAPTGRWPANVIFDEVTGIQGWSRFFYVAKASKRERNKGLEGLPEKESGVKNDSGRGFSESDPYKKVLNQNHHPTVKPIKLMEYLVKLITPPKGTVLDPFMGSGSTGVACNNLGFNFVGIEVNEEYLEIAKKRIDLKTLPQLEMSVD